MTIFQVPKDTVEFLISLLPALNAVNPEDFNQGITSLCLSYDGNLRRRSYARCGCVLFHGFPQLRKYLADHPLQTTRTNKPKANPTYVHILKALHLNTYIGQFVFGDHISIRSAGKALQIANQDYDVLTADDAANRIKIVLKMLDSV